MKLPLLLSSFALALAAGTAFAAPINMGGPLTGTQLTTFDDVAGGSGLGTNYNGALVSGGVSFGERFIGQTNTPLNGFDVLSGQPTATLSLAFGAAGQNLNVATYIVTSSNFLSGLGPPPTAGGGDNIGEGAFAALFSTNQSEIGFDLVGGNLGTATVSFFRRDGSLIQSVVLSNLSDQSYTFQRDLGVFDIAGLSVFNSDPGGLGIDNLRFNVPSSGTGGGTVPEPTSLGLAALALFGLGLSIRRKAVTRNTNPSRP